MTSAGDSQLDDLVFETYDDDDVSDDSDPSTARVSESEPRTQPLSADYDADLKFTAVEDMSQTITMTLGSTLDTLDTQATETMSSLPYTDLSASAQDMYSPAFDKQRQRDAMPVPYDMNSLPAHACAYCGIHDPKCVVHCDVCDRWFCNSRGKTSGAHIINHLIRSKHKTVSLHKKSLVGDTNLECYECQTRNIWVLGFVAATEEDLVVILCRDNCANNQKRLRELQWNGKSWQPLIKDRQLLDWMVREPPTEMVIRSRPLLMPEIVRLEELWKKDPSADLSALQAPEHREATVRPVQLTYGDAKDYFEVYEPLVNLEAEYDRKVKEALIVEKISCKWDLSLSRYSKMIFMLPRARLDYELKVACGDELQMSHASEHWAAKGVVSRIDALSGEIWLDFRELVSESVTSLCADFSMQFVWKPTTFERMQRAMHTLHDDESSVTGHLFHVLMGHEVVPQSLDCEMPATLSVPGLPQLNHSQMAAVKHCLKQPLSLIQGPPGTGKTVTSASIVYHLVQQRQGQVLVTAPSNIAVDHLTQKIDNTLLKVVRVVARSRESLQSPVSKLHLNRLVIELAKLTKSELWSWHSLKMEMGELRREDQRKYDRLFATTARKLLDNADVICCTCAGAGALMLERKFKQVLIDESTQATEPECLIPIVKGAKQVVLVGDHCQLGPVIMCKKAANAGLQRSLFERLIRLSVKPVRLQVQYRMHPCLSVFSSNSFYEGTLQNGVTKEERTLECMKSFWPNAELPMFFYCSFGREEFAASGTSFLNRTEAQSVEKCVTKMIRLGVLPGQIGIVTPYEGQRQYLVSHMKTQGVLESGLYEEIEVASVDSFQGREKDFIILSCVRSNTHHGIGFLNDPRRLNVAMTRAKFGFVVIGNPTLLSRQILWHNLLNHFKSNGLLVQGSLDSLRQSTITLSKPRKYFNQSLLLMPDSAKVREEQLIRRMDDRSFFSATFDELSTMSAAPSARETSLYYGGSDAAAMPVAYDRSLGLSTAMTDARTRRPFVAGGYFGVGSMAAAPQMAAGYFPGYIPPFEGAAADALRTLRSALPTAHRTQDDELRSQSHSVAADTGTLQSLTDDLASLKVA